MTPFTDHYERLKHVVAWTIELPTSLESYFKQRGTVRPLSIDDRGEERRVDRRRAIMRIERSHLPRSTAGYFGIYTRDFSHSGASFLSPFKMYAGEQVSIILPEGRFCLEIVRNRELAPRCYEVGAIRIAAEQTNLAAIS